MISGSTLLNFFDKYSLKEYFSKRISKTLLPYIIWSFIALIFNVFCLKNINLSDLSVKYIFDRLSTGNMIDIYWFFIPLFCVYLSIPLFAAVKKDKRKTVFTYLVVLGFILNILLPFINTVFDINILSSITVSVVKGYLFYVLVGYLITNYEIDKRIRYIIYVLGIFGLLIHIIGTYSYSMSAGYIIQTFKGYNNLPCVLYSVAIFIFFKYFGERALSINLISKIVNVVKKYTFSVYLTHWFILRILVWLFPINTYSIVYRLGIPFVVLIIVIVLTYIVRKIKLGRLILP